MYTSIITGREKITDASSTGETPNCHC